MSRVDFSRATRRLIEKRAGHQCSYPVCNRLTIGIGIAAHIYSASPGGPRGQGKLSPEELQQPENGIWLCSDHAKLVDNDRGATYPPETLLIYKAIQEARVVHEVQGLYSPRGWIHELAVYENPLFKRDQKMCLGKLNLLYGPNCSGKTALTEWIAGCFDSSYLKRWQTARSEPIHVRLSYLNPIPHSVDLQIEADKSMEYRIDGREVPFNPFEVRFIRLTNVLFTYDDDLLLLSNALSLPTHAVRNLIGEIHAFRYAHVRKLRFETDKEDGLNRLYADVDGTAPGLSLRGLGFGETEGVLIEFATAAARVWGRHTPTVLILDGCPSMLSDGIFDYYSHHLLDPENQFQTIMCVPSRELDLDSLKRKGWRVIRTSGSSPSISITQEPRAT